jgi:xanthine dehydrogenase accessory factor
MRRELYAELQTCLGTRQLVVLASVVAGSGLGRQLLIWPRGETFGDLGSPRLNQRAALYAEQILPGLRSSRKTFRWNEEEVDVFFDVFSPSPELVAVGAGHVAVPLVELARVVGFRTVVVDPRSVFSTRERFPRADEVITGWPQEALPEVGIHAGSHLAILSHDPKIDLPALEIALRSPARYIGVLGSTRTHAKRLAALRERGFEPQDLERVHAPIGLDLGGRKAEEIALAILAEMVAVGYGRASRTGKGGRPG